MEGKPSARENEWSDLFDAYDLLQKIEKQGFVDITAKDFHQLHLQPRLLTKMDHATQVPAVFSENGLNIITRGINIWRIGHYQVFQPLPEWTLPDSTVEDFSFPAHLQTLNPNRLTGESAVINTAFAAGLLEDFCGEALILTVSGRMRSGKFTFSLNNTSGKQSEIEVAGAQIEIDAGLEGHKHFNVFEVKNHLSTDFCIRQLYYPFRTWKNQLSQHHPESQKEIRTIFLSYANDVFDLYEFEFTQPLNYSSLTLRKHKRYTISLSRPDTKDVVSLAKRAIQSRPFSPPNGVPFPQADAFERVLDLLSFLSEQPRTVDDLALNYDFHPRQSDYYYNAAKYLGLAESKSDVEGRQVRSVTDLGKSILAKSYREKTLAIAQILLSIPPINTLYLNLAESGIKPTIENAIDEFKSSGYSTTHSGEPLADSSARRRAQTILAWVNWLKNVSK